MRFLMMYRPDASPENAGPPSPEAMAVMGRYIDEMTRAGVLVATGGLLPSSRGARVRRARGQVTVTQGPLEPAEDLIAGFAVVKARSDRHAIELASEFLELAGDGTSEVRPMYEPSTYMMMYRPEGGADAVRPPTEEQKAAMGRYIDEMTRAGVLITSGGLMPSSQGARVRLARGMQSVTDGPFTEAKELIAGYAVVELPSMAAAIESAAEFLALAGDGSSEIRTMMV